jgi:hypothetical protein
MLETVEKLCFGKINGYMTSLWKCSFQIYLLCLKQNITVEQVKNDPTAVLFTRWLVDKWREDWVKILHDTSLFNLNLCDNGVSWKFGLKGIFFCQICI